jgi:hypothetical protein
MMNISNTLIPCAGVVGIIHVQDIHYHVIDDLSLGILMGVDGRGLGELGVQQ